MNIFIVDTNIVFSAILSPNGKIAEFLETVDSERVKLFAPGYILIELNRHESKLIKLTKLDEAVVEDRQAYFMKSVVVIPDDDIPIDYFF